jgi:hypothetical protein
MGSNQMAATTVGARTPIVPTSGLCRRWADSLASPTNATWSTPPTPKSATRLACRLEAAADAADPLLSTLEALLPLDEDRIRDWRLLFTFLGLAPPTPHSPQNNAPASPQRARIEQAIAAEQEAGHLRTDIDAEATGRFLLAVVLGRRSSTRPAGPKIACAAGCTAH